MRHPKLQPNPTSQLDAGHKRSGKCCAEFPETATDRRTIENSAPEGNGRRGLGGCAQDGLDATPSTPRRKISESRENNAQISPRQSAEIERCVNRADRLLGGGLLELAGHRDRGLDRPTLTRWDPWSRTPCLKCPSMKRGCQERDRQWKAGSSQLDQFCLDVRLRERSPPRRVRSRLSALIRR
jgi:hypothetical protein